MRTLLTTLVLAFLVAEPAHAAGLRLERIGRFQEPVSVTGTGATLAVVERYGHRHPRWCAITGGYVLRGRYLYGDLCSGRIWSARLAGSRLARPRRTRLRVPYLVSFGRDGAGRVHAVSFFGAVYRLAQSRNR